MKSSAQMAPVSLRPAATRGFCHMLSWPAAEKLNSQIQTYKILVEYGWWWGEKKRDKKKEECESVYHSLAGSLQYECCVPHRVYLSSSLSSLLSCQLIDLITHKDAATFYNAGTKWHSTRKWNLKKMVGDRRDIFCFVSVSFSEIHGMRLSMG